MKKKAVILIEFLILASVLISFLLERSKGEEALFTGISIDSFKSDHAVFDGRVWHIDPGMAEGSDKVDMLYGPFAALHAGDYTIVCSYDCDTDQEMVPYIAGNDTCVESGILELDHRVHTLSYDFRLRQDTDKFEIRVRYDGDGALELSDLRVYRNLSGYKRLFAILFALFLFLDLCYIKRKWFADNMSAAAYVAALTFIISLPVFVDGLTFGHDIGFHINRIEGIAENLSAGNIPARMLPSWISGFGYPALIYYGNLFLYIPAVLRLFGFSVITSYKTYIVLVNFATVLFSYYSFGLILKNKKIALISTTAYVTATYRLVNVFIRAAVGEYTAMAFYPLVAAAMYMIYTDRQRESAEDKRRHRKYALLLALGMTGIAECHTLSTEIIIELLVVFAIVMIKQTIRPGTLKDIFLAIGIAALFNLFFFVPFLDYYVNESVNLTDVMKSWGVAYIQNSGMHFAQLFAFFQQPVDYSNDAKICLTPGIVLMMAFFAAVFFMLKKRADKRVCFTAFFSLALLILASSVFPWDFMASHFKLWNYLAQIEFPWRYLAPCCLMLALLLGFMLVQEEKTGFALSKEHLIYVIVCACMCNAFLFLSQYIDNEYTVYYYDGPDILYYDYGEFLRAGVTKDIIDAIDTDIITENADASIISRHCTDTVVECRAMTDGRVTLPILNYRGYRAYDDTGAEVQITDGEYCMISLYFPEGYEGNVRISFEEPWYWRLSEIISLISVAGTAAYIIISRKRKRGSV